MIVPDAFTETPTLFRHNRETAGRILRLIEDGTFCAVLGPRFSGKSVLVRAVGQELAQQLQVPCVYLDLYDVEASTLRGFFAGLVSLTAERVAQISGVEPPQPDAESTTSVVFRGFLSDVLTELRRDLVLIIDHLEAIPTDLVQALLTSLRAAYMDQQLVQNRLMVVASGALSLATLTVGESSPFRGIAERVFVGDLSDSDSETLIAETLAAAGLTTSDRARRKLLDAARGDPYLIQRLSHQAVREAGTLSSDRLRSKTVDLITQSFLSNEAVEYAPLREAVRVIEDDPDLLHSILLLKEHGDLPTAALPLPLSPDVDPLYLTGVVDKMAGARYRLRNGIYCQFLSDYFDPGRVGHLLTMAGRWDSAIDYLESSVSEGNDQYLPDLFSAIINSMYASEDLSRAAHFLARGLSAAFGINKAQVWYALPRENRLRLVGQLGPVVEDTPWANQEMSVHEDSLEARVYRDGHSLRGSESGSWAKRAIPLLTEGRKPIGVVMFHDELAGERFAEQRERDLKLVGYLNQTARALQKVGQRTQELALAGQVQASLLPRVPPRVSDWRFAATLQPAKDTAGDFYDIIPLPGGRLGLVVADVTDKGLGAALYMALSQTLIRTYAREFPDEPDRVLAATSARILRDTRAGLFVTVFYGVFDPAAATLTYCNAGHNPPYLLSPQGRDSSQILHRTGMALGVIEDTEWERQEIRLDPGTVLLLYTDGVVDAHNRPREAFGSERMLEIVQGNLGRSPNDIQNALLTGVFRFVGDEPQFDDITLLIAARDAKAEPRPAERRAVGVRRLPPQEPI